MECGDGVTALGPAERATSGERVAVKPRLTVTKTEFLSHLCSRLGRLTTFDQTPSAGLAAFILARFSLTLLSASFISMTPWIQHRSVP